ncbi:hypothetical protein TELCIR_05324 [Teladorsagia circumcincta]|uniref:Vesicle transport protein USE1 n=1 Tax=Teladorsagia circumcincta TaxID=45464 RepID=A0A2G9UR29_TELCI|nr:hypothetical protein TELCIR_05324 [Teladorsagia circumcincta]
MQTMASTRAKCHGDEEAIDADVLISLQKINGALLKALSTTNSVCSGIASAAGGGNQRLSSMHAQVDANTARLSAEGVRLAHHAYKCGFDCALVFVALFIFWSFICMVVVMKIFPKRHVS